VTRRGWSEIAAGVRVEPGDASLREGDEARGAMCFYPVAARERRREQVNVIEPGDFSVKSRVLEEGNNGSPIRVRGGHGSSHDEVYYSHGAVQLRARL